MSTGGRASPKYHPDNECNTRSSIHTCASSVGVCRFPFLVANPSIRYRKNDILALDTMEELLDTADAWLATYPDEPPRPDFPLPSDYDPSSLDNLMETRQCHCGKGWFAKTSIPAGTVLLIEKPISMVMDWLEPCDEDIMIHDTDERRPEMVNNVRVDANGEEGGNYDPDDDNNNNNNDGEEEGVFMELSSRSLKSTLPIDEEQQCGDSRLNEIMLLELLSMIQENELLWTDQLSLLFPRDTDTISKLPVWVCSDDDVFLQVERMIQALAKETSLLPEDIKDLNLRLPLVIRYNVLSVETCSELLVYPGPAGHSAMSGMGIFHKASFFNHDSKPNVSRYAIGDIMWFVANQEISEDSELCISYLEHDVLCEPISRRTNMLGRDFGEPGGDGTEDDGPDLPVVDDNIQNELMGMDPIQRLKDLKQLMAQATGEQTPELMDDDTGNLGWFQCDLQNLRIILAITLDGLGRTKEALSVWEQCVIFTETALPPNDEASVVMRVQAALCAQLAGNMDRAQTHATKALETHTIIFGGGMTRFRRRYDKELKLALRPDADENARNTLWPLSSYLKGE